jgi:geranylgeranyl reductase family protein
MPDRYDAIVIGAGLAGSTAAHALARAGVRTILLEKAILPRPKVCGGCLSSNGVALLTQQGLGPALDRVSISGMCELRLRTPRTGANITVDNGRVIDRRTFDEALANEAVSAGAEFRTNTTVTSIEGHATETTVTTRTRDGHTHTLRARAVINATGLTTLSARDDGAPRIARASRIGLSAIVSDASSNYEPSITHMHAIRHGYAGIVRLDANTLNIAAAVDPSETRDAGVTPFIRELFRSTGAPIPEGLDNADWTGTPRLTRTRSPATGHLLHAGDSAGYVEPFTGEGMTWAVASAIAAARCVADWLDDPSIDLAAAYNSAHKRAVAKRWKHCALVRAALRRPFLTDTIIRLANISTTFTRLARSPFEQPYTPTEATP